MTDDVCNQLTNILTCIWLKRHNWQHEGAFYYFSFSAQQNAIEDLERRLRVLEEKRQELLEVDGKRFVAIMLWFVAYWLDQAVTVLIRYFHFSINLDAIKELEKQLQNVEDERKLVKEGPSNALER